MSAGQSERESADAQRICLVRRSRNPSTAPRQVLASRSRRAQWVQYRREFSGESRQTGLDARIPLPDLACSFRRPGRHRRGAERGLRLGEAGTEHCSHATARGSCLVHIVARSKGSKRAAVQTAQISVMALGGPGGVRPRYGLSSCTSGRSGRHPRPRLPVVVLLVASQVGSWAAVRWPHRAAARECRSITVARCSFPALMSLSVLSGKRVLAAVQEPGLRCPHLQL